MAGDKFGIAVVIKFRVSPKTNFEFTIILRYTVLERSYRSVLRILHSAFAPTQNREEITLL